MKTTTATLIDFDAHYRVQGYRGIAFYLVGYATTQKPLFCYCLDEDGEEMECESGEFEQAEDRDNVVCVMVGDDRRHTVSVDDIELIPEDGFCRGCGQIGCRCEVWS